MWLKYEVDPLRMKFSSVVDDSNTWQIFSLKFKMTSFVTDKNCLPFSFPDVRTDVINDGFDFG